MFSHVAKGIFITVSIYAAIKFVVCMVVIFRGHDTYAVNNKYGFNKITYIKNYSPDYLIDFIPLYGEYVQLYLPNFTVTVTGDGRRLCKKEFDSLEIPLLEYIQLKETGGMWTMEY